MKFVVEYENLKDYSSDYTVCDSYEEANKEAVLFGISFKRNPVRGTLSLLDAATVSIIHEESLNDSAFGDDDSIDWNDFDPNAVFPAPYGFTGRTIADLIINLYPEVNALAAKDSMLSDAGLANLKSLCKEVHEFGRGFPTVDFINGNAESCIDAFNYACLALNICIRRTDGSSESLRVEYNW